jgi:hypothetical protein
MIVALRTVSFAGDRHVSHKPPIAINPPPLSAIA